ncbi:GAF domain-containing protein [Rhodothermus sp. AH-315-K08]|nr:GAF domain-containing protein [Rhodothermus sp. AH-315-K08]
MKNYRRFTIVVFFVALTLASTGVALYVLVPARMLSRADDALVSRAKSTAEYVASYVRVGISEKDSSSVHRAAELAVMDPDLDYAVVVGEWGRVIATATGEFELGNDWATYFDIAFREELETVTAAVINDDRLVASVYVGLRREAVQAAAREDGRLMIGFSAFLIFLAICTAAGVFQMKRLSSAAKEWQQRHKSVRLQAGTLQSSVREHRQNERSLRESESKYKSLFESTMASAMADLEKMNSNLERRQADLEHEVGVRKHAEHALRGYTLRLQLLNSIERSLLEGEEIVDSVRLALVRMGEMVPAVHVSLIESNLPRGTAQIIGLVSKKETPRKLGQAIPLESVEHGVEMVHRADLLNEEDFSDAERGLLAEGLRSYVNVPLVVQEESVGVLCLESDEPGVFTDEHFSIARDVADLLAIGIHRARLDDERELYEKELILSRDRAEDMARLKTAFLTNMSHEIRTPISGMMGFAQVLHEEVPEHLKEFTGLIRESSQRLLNTINSVLELARLESGTAGMESATMDLTESAKDVAGTMESLALRKQLTFQVETEPQALWCYLDRACVDRIITNLVDNAIKFTDEGGVGIAVTRHPGAGRVTVSDTGIGIGEEFLPLLFDDFRQEQMDANREHEGSGLGLSVAKKLVDRLGGTISVESEKGVGTTVTVDFPLSNQAPDHAGTKAVVLVVTSNPDACEMLSLSMAPAIGCAQAANLTDASQILAEGEFAAIIVDVNSALPNELEAGMRALCHEFPNLKRLAFASQVMPEDPAHLLELGFSEYVAAPFEKGEMLNALSEEPATTTAARAVKGWGAGKLSS